MTITHMHSYLVHPGKNIDESERPEIHYATLELSGKLYTMLHRVYERALDECKTAVTFTTDTKSNPARDVIVSYAETPRVTTGLKLAKRLQGVTDGSPGIGLLFLVRGEVHGKIKTMISRFPADVGILAEENKKGLNIEYLEKVFMKNSNKYKAALYIDSSPKSSYWKGSVVDNQIGYGVMRSVSDYWVIDFLASDCFTTPASGSARLATMVGEAVKKADDPTVKDELVSIAKLIPNLSGKKVSPELVAKQFSLSPTATDALSSAAKTPELFTEQFVLDNAAFTKVLSFESVELDNGAVLTAPSGQWNKVFKEEILDVDNGLRLFKTEGSVTDKRFKKVKP